MGWARLLKRLSELALDDEPMQALLAHSITYRIAVGPRTGRKVFTLQSLPAGDEGSGAAPAQVGGFSLHAGVAARADERKKLERLCRYISRPAVSEARLSLTAGGHVRYQLKTPYRDGTTHVRFECVGFHRAAGRAGAQAARQSHPLPRRVRPEQRPPGAGDQGPPGQGRKSPGSGRDRRARPCRAPGVDALGATPQARLRHRHRGLPGVRRGAAHHRVHRRPGRDREDSRPPRCESGYGPGYPAAASLRLGCTRAGRLNHEQGGLSGLYSEQLHHAVDYTPYEGMTLRAWPAMTLMGGEVIWDGGRFYPRSGRGRFLACGRPTL